MIACCGIDCLECEAYLATRFDDNEKRIKVAEQWSKQFKADIKPADINCESCLSNNGIIFSHCRVCEIRNCCREKSIDNCAYCDEYGCEKTKILFSMVPEAKSRLDTIRASLQIPANT